MHPRIYGTELEYGVFCWELVPAHMTLDSFLSSTNQIVASLPATSNGSRIYHDTGNHPEYAAPECRTPRELVA